MKDKKPTYRIEAVLEFDVVDSGGPDDLAAKVNAVETDGHNELTIETVIDAVAHKFDVPAEEITNENRPKEAEEACYAAVYLAKRLVHADRMNKAKAKDPEGFLSYGWVAMRAITRDIDRELSVVFGEDYGALYHYEKQAVRLRKENEEFRKKTDDIWAEIDDAYELDTDHSHVIWRDQIEERMAQEETQAEERPEELRAQEATHEAAQDQPTEGKE